MKKTILIIGAGIGQVYIVQEAQKMGCYVIVVSPKGNYPAIDIADELFECDIYDRVRIVEFARSRGIDAVTSDQNDLMMPTVAYVAEALGLRGNTFEQVMSYCDKTRFRQVCESCDVPVPHHIEITDDTIPTAFNAPLPWIVKPADSQSSIGISKITTQDEYKDAANYALSKSKQYKAILEQFFTGTEYVCEGFVYQGKYYNLSFGDRFYFKDTLIPSQTIFPSTLTQEIKERIILCESKIAQSIGASFGIIHSEYLVSNETTEFCVVESAIRGGGVYISSHLIPFATGIDINSLLLRCALGKDVDVDDYLDHKKSYVSAYLCFTLPEGVITSVFGIEEVANISGVKKCEIHDIAPGTVTQKMTVKGARKGPILIQANNRVELQKIIQQIKNKLDIRVTTSAGVTKQIIWD